MSALPSVQLPSASTSPSTHFLCFYTFYSYIFAAIFVYIFYTHLWRYSGLYSAIATFSRPFSCKFCTPMPTFICGRTATPLFYTYTHLWMYSGLYSAIRGQFCIHFHKSTPTFICGRTDDVSILHLHSSVDVQRFLQCYSYIFAAIFVYIYVLPHLHSSRPITCLAFKVAKSAWLHFTHQTETSLLSTFSTFYIYA